MNISVGRYSKAHTMYTPNLTKEDWDKIDPEYLRIPLRVFDKIVLERFKDIVGT
jgi:hypothetical protein